VLIGLAIGAWLLLVGGSHLGWADEASVEDRPVSEAYERPHWLERAFDERFRKKTIFPRLKDALTSQPPFLRDTELLAHVRTYYLLRQSAGDPDNEAWAAGGWVRYRSGWLANTLQIGSTAYASWPLYAPADRDGTLLLAPGQESYAVLGEAYITLRYGEHRVTGYRQEVDTPYVNRQDNRMTPNTFEGVTILGKTPWFKYGAGYLMDMKQRNADEFISMSAAAGAAGSDAGLAFANVGLSPWRGLSIEAIEYFVPNVINIAYAEVGYVWSLGPDLGLAVGVQLTDQRSVGDDRLTGTAFDTWVGGAKAALRYAGAALILAVSTTSTGADIRSPFGTYPGYVSLIDRNFNRAGEDAWLIGLTYDFGRVGVPGLSAFFNVAQGTGARNPTTGEPRSNEREFDLTVDYRVTKKGWLEGLWLRLRGALVQDGGRTTENEIRLILNYEFPLL
jgi:hypothetical protein